MLYLRSEISDFEDRRWSGRALFRTGLILTTEQGPMGSLMLRTMDHLVDNTFRHLSWPIDRQYPKEVHKRPLVRTA